MRKAMTRRRVISALVIVGAGVLAGGVIAARIGGDVPDPQALHEAIEDAPLVRVADIAASGDRPSRGVFVQLTRTGHVCLWDAPSADSRQRGGGCNPADDPLGGSAVSANLAYEGGPAIEAVKDARLIGLASLDAASVEVLMSDGSRRAIRLVQAEVGADEYWAFGYRIKKSDLQRGIGPRAVIALDADGVEIARQPTGIGG